MNRRNVVPQVVLTVGGMATKRTGKRALLDVQRFDMAHY
jgi:hypothetical protein